MGVDSGRFSVQVHWGWLLYLCTFFCGGVLLLVDGSGMQLNIFVEGHVLEKIVQYFVCFLFL